MPEVVFTRPHTRLVTPSIVLTEGNKLIEYAGRACRNSYDKAVPDGANQFVEMLIRLGHESVLEHVSATYDIWCSRACSHQLVRHRLAAYSQESQRAIKYDQRMVVIPPPSMLQTLERTEMFHRSMLGAQQNYIDALQSGVVAEDARYILPNAIQTHVVTTYNLRVWRHVMRERALNKRAQKEIRYIMQQILRDLKTHIPCCFSDMEIPQAIVVNHWDNLGIAEE